MLSIPASVVGALNPLLTLGSDKLKSKIIFAGVSVFLFVRQVDGSGAENTTDVKLISFAIWLGFYLFLLALEYGIRFLCVIRKK